MNYQKLLKRHNWLSIQAVLIQIYPDQKHLISSYEHVYNELMTLEPEQTDLTLEIYERFIEGLDDEPITLVCGRKKKDEEFYSVEFVPWNQWLDMDVKAEILEHYSELEIIAHCLYEMTFIDFDQKTIQKEKKKLMEQINKIDNMTEEEKKKNLIPWEDLKKKYKYHFKDDE